MNKLVIVFEFWLITSAELVLNCGYSFDAPMGSAVQGCAYMLRVISPT